MLLITLMSCSGSSNGIESFASADFTTTKKDANNMTFTAHTTGSYELLEWVFPNNTLIDNKNSVDYYFPKKGEYKVSLNLWLKGDKVSQTKTITIDSDDANYGMKLVWNDEFDGTTLDDKNWTMEEGYIANNELQNYQKSGNHEVSGGILKITARKVNEDKKFGSYTSARMITHGKREFTYGRIEARMKLPKGTGTWPAFWMLGSSIFNSTPWPACGEIDIMEHVGYDPGVIHGSLHSATFSGADSKSGVQKITDEDNWHVYGVNWSADQISFYIDDHTKPYFTFPIDNTMPYNKPNFIILNLAIGGDWGGLNGVNNSTFPVVMEVDYVRVYQEKQ